MHQKVKNNSTNRFLNPDGQFQQPFPQCSHVQRCEIGSGSSATPLLEEDVGCCRHEHAKLIGQEIRAGGPIDFEAMMEVLDPVLGVSFSVVDAVHSFWLVPRISDNKTIVVSGIAAGIPLDLGPLDIIVCIGCLIGVCKGNDLEKVKDGWRT